MLPESFGYKQDSDEEPDDADIPVSGNGLASNDNLGGRPSEGRGQKVPSRGVGTQAGRGGAPTSGVSGLGRIATDRPIFTLSVAADLLGLHPRTLRIYEEKGLVIPARTDGNRRRYSQNDIQRFGVIRQLTKGGVNLEGVRIILDMVDELNSLGGNPVAIIEKNLQTPFFNEP